MLTIDIPTIIFEIINFLVLAALLYVLLFRPILRGINDRAEERRQTEERIAASLHETEAMRAELEARLADVDKQIAAIVSEAQDRMDESRRNTLQSARLEAERILKEAASEARQLQQKTISDSMDDLLATMREVNTEVIRQTAAPDTHNHLVQELNDRIWQLGSKEMDQVDAIRRSLGERAEPTVVAETAKKLEPKQVQELRRTLSALVDREVELDINVNPDLILGLRVRVGDTLINNSIADKLDKILRDASASLQEALNHA